MNHNLVRDAETCHADFVFYADRVIRMVVEFALDLLPVVPKTVTTPVDGASYAGVAYDSKICGVR